MGSILLNSLMLFQCELSSGVNRQSASWWQKKLKWELKKQSDNISIDSMNLLQTINYLLINKVEKWAGTTIIERLLEDLAPTAETVMKFSSLFFQRFLSKVQEDSTDLNNTEIANLRQQEGESLATYYWWVFNLLTHVGGWDNLKLTMTTPSSEPLSLIERAMLNTIMRVFTQGLKNHDIHQNFIWGLMSVNRFLHRIYMTAEEARWMKAEYKHLQKEFILTQNFQFYKETVQQNMLITRINSLRAAYQTHNTSLMNSQAWSIKSLSHTYFDPASVSALSYPSQNQPSYNSYQTSTQPAQYNLRLSTVGRAEDGGVQFHNLYVNGIKIFVTGRGVLICIKCEKEGHISCDCFNSELSQAEQGALQDIVFGSRDHLPFRSTMAQAAPSAALVTPASAGAHSVTYGLASLQSQPTNSDVYSTEALIGKGSELNKRSHIESVVSLTVPLASQPSVSPITPQSEPSAG